MQTPLNNLRFTIFNTRSRQTIDAVLIYLLFIMLSIENWCLCNKIKLKTHFKTMNHLNVVYSLEYDI